MKSFSFRKYLLVNINYFMIRNIVLFFLLFILLVSNKSFSQNVEVYPSNWWVGMKWNKVQLMMHEKTYW